MNHDRKLKKLTLDEIADGYILSENLSKNERAKVIKEFREEGKKALSNLSNEKRVLSSILQLRFEIEDYLKKNEYNKETSFCYFLKEYIIRLQLKNKDFAEQMGMEPSELSHILNGHRKPNDKILIRLELHSNKNINAMQWYKILERDKEYELSTNNRLREEERPYVKQYFSFSFG
ncbi:XRE family transcriptional regulator [Chitinophaga silvatica]|uniref:XRE family transcriptional regulator n=1 Tax=Chitinophaga silvatica TaxID=2282649 RepID=A0A3E1YE72_9BACT|nr:helix-turn-helix transcriptional regulator [Chitinophaga silvatica]RFS24753.1 XRE family transcriptional regulator [Chitinophaga silvatica]